MAGILLRLLQYVIRVIGPGKEYLGTEAGNSCVFLSDVLVQSICTTIHSLLWRHNGRDSVSNHQPHRCLLKRLFRRSSKKTSKLRVTGLCVGNSPVTGEFPAQMASNAENVSHWWGHGKKSQHQITWNPETMRKAIILSDRSRFRICTALAAHVTFQNDAMIWQPIRRLRNFRRSVSKISHPLGNSELLSEIGEHSACADGS